MTTFDNIRNFLSSFKKGDIITRKLLMSKELGLRTTIDQYRNWFTQAGYLKWVKAGFYELVKTPNSELTSRTLRKEAYPHYKNWNEYRNANNVYCDDCGTEWDGKTCCPKCKPQQ